VSEQTEEGNFVERIRRRMLEERLRNPLAQYLLWTTDKLKAREL
jgi:hypothetical protein